jgi:hypothetical protein
MSTEALPRPSAYWRPPGPSVATRIPSPRSRGSSRSSIVGGAEPRRIYCESGLEEKAAYSLLADPNVVDLWEQPAAVEYVDEYGKKRRHTFDFVVLLKDGTRIAIQVKPWKRSEKWRAILARIAAQMPRRFADFVLLLTERDLPRDLVHNSVLIHAVRRDPPRGYDEQLREIVATLNGSVKVADLVKHSGLEGRGFRAVVRLIANGELIVHGNGRIDYGTSVSRAATPPAGDAR